MSNAMPLSYPVVPEFINGLSAATLCHSHTTAILYIRKSNVASIADMVHYKPLLVPCAAPIEPASYTEHLCKYKQDVSTQLILRPCFVSRPLLVTVLVIICFINTVSIHEIYNPATDIEKQHSIVTRATDTMAE